MRSFKKKVISQLMEGYKESNEECDYYPCHHVGQNCTLCYCPFYPCSDEELGRYVEGRDGRLVWSCKYCLWIHRGDVVKECIREFKGKDLESLGREELDRIKSSVEDKSPKQGTTNKRGRS